jgi:hypothetical protein
MSSRLKTRLDQPCQTEYLPSVGDIYKAQTFIAGAASSLKGGVLWSKNKLKASKGCCQSR